MVSPSHEIRLLAEHIYQETIEDLRFDTIISREKASLFLRAADIWTPRDDEGLKKLEEHLENRKVDLFQSLFDRERQKRMRRAIVAAKKGLNKAYAKKHSLEYMTLDYHAYLNKKKFIVALCLRDSDNNPVYTEQNYNTANSSILEKVMNFLDSDIITIEEFRELARNDPWKTMWNLGKESCIALPASEWTEEQKTLMTFAKMYDNAYQSTDCPSDEVFEDDDMFDGWMIDQRRTREKEQKQKQVENNGKIPEGAQEVFLHAPTREDANRVYDLNDLDGRMTIQQRQQLIQTRGRVDAKDMPDTQMELRRQQVEEYKNKFRKG